ncbi:MAG: hypothetical protein BBJ57_03440 [Desulfobacterales bacterium PC51MH44]|nr:MAG: hypothetical protein BBJ57_03440 [Desulfobacterales bacterium PC51MH44]
MAIFRAKNTLLREEHGQMARAKRHFLPGHARHITHRYHKRETRHPGKGPKGWGVEGCISSS